MKSNVGGADRKIRLILGIILLPLGIFVLTGTIKVVTIVLGIVGLGTGLINWCPINQILGINSCGTRK